MTTMNRLTREFLSKSKLLKSGLVLAGFGIAVPAYAGCEYSTCAVVPYDTGYTQSQTTYSSTPTTTTYSGSTYSAPTYVSSSTYSQTYSQPYQPATTYQSYAQPAYPAYTGPGEIVGVNQTYYEDEIVTYGQRNAFKRQEYYFNPRDYRSFDCRGNRCSFEFKGRTRADARAVEYYLSQALIAAAGPAVTYTDCDTRYGGDKVVCKMRGDLSYLDTRALRYALYGR